MRESRSLDKPSRRKQKWAKKSPFNLYRILSKLIPEPERRPMTDRLRELMQQRFGETVEIDSGLTRSDQLEPILSHCSHRSFTSAAIEPELLRLLFACALSAPTKSDLQQADIVHVADPVKRRAIESLIPSMPWMAEAPAFLVICGNGRRIRETCQLRNKPFANDHLDSFFNASVDASLVLMNFIRAAEAVGLGCCPISAVRNHAARISALLNLPDWVFPVAGLCVGYPADAPRVVPRLSLNTTIHIDTYNDESLRSEIDDYDQRRSATLPYGNQRYSDDYGQAEFYGWSEDKARQVSKPERSDFGRFIRDKRYQLE